MVFKKNSILSPAAQQKSETAKYQQQEDLSLCLVVPAVGSRPALWILSSLRLSKMEMEVLTWIPEFYNQLQDTLKEWLLASLPFVYGQKPEIKMLIHQPNLSAHNNSVRTQRWISFSVQVANSYLLLCVPSSPDLCSAMKPSGAGRRAAAAQRQAGHWLAGDEQLCCVPRALYSVFVFFFFLLFLPPHHPFLIKLTLSQATRSCTSLFNFLLYPAAEE